MRGERPFIYHTPNGREMFQALQKNLPALRTGAVNRAVGDGVLQWSAAEQMPLGYAVPAARRCRAARPPLGGGCRRSRLGERKRRLLPLPLSALRAATSLAEGGKGRTDCRVASLLAMTALRAVWVRRPTKKEAPARVLPLHILNASAACRTACSAMCPDSGTAAPAGSE